ncbi:MAG: hypothetical protein HS126_16925 [Anaerolineales bacterium]|nr:hypothetical protein [Anaerolineales bacterium]
MFKLSKAEVKLLSALMNGSTLKSHRYLDGTKVYQLHSLEGQAKPVQQRHVEALQRRDFIISNQKFPVATYSLTEQGRQLAAILEEISIQSRNFFSILNF